MKALAVNIQLGQPTDGQLPHATRPTPRQLAEQGVRFVPQTLRYLGVADASVLDAAQDVFLVALRKLDDFEGRSSLTTWLYGICLWVAHDYRRRQRRSREALVDILPDVGIAGSQESDLARAERQRHLTALLDRLEEPQREVFVLFELQRLSMKEVAEIVGCSLQTAYYRHKSARERVLSAFQRQMDQEEL